MDEKTKNVVIECSKGSEEGHLSFPEVLKKLSEANIEHYHADLVRSEKTYYTADGKSYVVQSSVMHDLPMANLSSDGVKAALKAIQQKQIDYIEFCKCIVNAGCIGYLVSLSGRQAIYFGRKAEYYIEPFPAAVGPLTLKPVVN